MCRLEIGCLYNSNSHSIKNTVCFLVIYCLGQLIVTLFASYFAPARNKEQITVRNLFVILCLFYLICIAEYFNFFCILFTTNKGKKNLRNAYSVFQNFVYSMCMLIYTFFFYKNIQEFSFDFFNSIKLETIFSHSSLIFRHLLFSISTYQNGCV